MKRAVTFRSLALTAVAVTLITGTAGCVNSIARDALTVQPEALALRRLQTRRFEVPSEEQLLSAAVATLQDLGFSLDQSEPALGLIVASKNREAAGTGEIFAHLLIGGITNSEVRYDVEQKIRSSVVTRQVERGAYTLRVTFQRTVWNNRGEISGNETIEEPELYQDFFTKLSYSLNLTRHQG